ncbi:IS110 family transposase [uncultured Ferrimonas sp.]|uniref:IS110 family transposase n=1 Tax=uncultured Ferrimonas sp. TaxID=432640 RepID=UPI00260CE7C7|nr:IS110 family transposase [uncultured Ferrimonas sp.]
MNIKTAGIDLAKNVFQVCVLRDDGSIKWNRKVARSKLLHVIRQFPEGTVIAMEACASAHHWGRTLLEMGFKPLLLPAQAVKPFTHHQKNDVNDALAICEAAQRPSIHAVSVKSTEQQDIKALRCVRSRRVEQRTATSNQIRALAMEYGVVFPQGITTLLEAVPDAIAEPTNGLTATMRSLLAGLADDIRLLNGDIEELSCQIAALCKQQDSYQSLLEVPGFGPICAAALISEVGDGKQFQNGRQLSAWCGLIPSQHSSGGKSKLGAITKHGNKDLRVLLIHGARAVIRFIDKRDDPLGSWVRQLIERRGKHKATVALANKLARISWCILSKGCRFDASLAFVKA